MDILITAIIFIVMLSILVLIHEAGHFFVARRMGMKVEEFGLGLPPRLWATKRGETEYSLNALPIGGFVRIYGESADGLTIQPRTDQPDADRAFLSKSKLARTAVLLAGVTANLLLGIIIFTIVYAIGLPSFDAQPVVDQVAANSPAQQAGLKSGDLIVAVNHHTYGLSEISSAIGDRRGHPITLTVKSGNTQHDITVTPRANPPKGQGPLGVSIEGGHIYVSSVERYPVYLSWWVGIQKALSFVWLILLSLGQMFTGFVSHGTVPSDVAGPVGIAAILNQARALGVIPVLWFVATISVNLAVVNVLPIPALDGGRLLFVIIEALSGRKVNPNIERWVHTAGMAFLLALIALITFSDIRRFF